MKKITTVSSLLILLFHFSSTAQTLDWAKSVGSTGSDIGYCVAVDDLGNVYTAGKFVDTVDFDPNEGITTLTSSGDQSAFLQKLDRNGNLVWVKSITGEGSTIIIGMTLDDVGNIYITGNANGEVDFDPNDGVVTLPIKGGTDIFVEKLDNDGSFIWAKRVGWKANDSGESIAVDALGNVYTTGRFTGEIDFDTSEEGTTILSSGGSGVFVQKLDTNGDFIWAKEISATDTSVGNSIKVDESGNVYTTGHFRGNLDFDPSEDEYILSSNGGPDAFTQKLDTDGNFIWASSIGGPQLDAGKSVAIDVAGNVYTVGYFSGTVDFDPSEEEFNLTSLGGQDAFIQKLDIDGNLLWVKVFGGDGQDVANSVEVDSEAAIYISGVFAADIEFGTDTDSYQLTAIGEQDAFVLKLNATSELGWVETMGGEESKAVGWDLTFDDSLNIYTIGFFSGTVDFDPAEETTFLESVGYLDVFIQKIIQTPVVGVTSPVLYENAVIFPNPTNGLFVMELPSEATNAQVDIVNDLGITVYHKEINDEQNEFDLSHLPTGIYYVNMKTNTGKQFYAKVILNR